MGDKRRFAEFALLVNQQFPDKEARIVDVACGKGMLNGRLRMLGYQIAHFRQEPGPCREQNELHNSVHVRELHPVPA